MTIAENLNRILEAKADIKAAIEKKGVNVGDVSIEYYARKIDAIPQQVVSNKKFPVPNGMRIIGTMTTIDVSSWDLSNTSNISMLFYNNEKLNYIIGINDWDVTNVTHTSSLFEYCSLYSMDISNWDIAEKLKDMSYMFKDCIYITEINMNNVAKNGTWGTMGMFDGCTNLQTVHMKNWDLSGVSKLGTEFADCTSLKTLDMENTIFSNGVNGGYILKLNSCTELENVIFGKQALGSWDFSYNTKLTRESLLSIIDGLAEHSTATFTLKIGSSNLSKLTEQDIAVATAKGWTITA